MRRWSFVRTTAAMFAAGGERVRLISESSRPAQSRVDSLDRSGNGNESYTVVGRIAFHQ